MKKDEIFSTRDIYLASTLITLGFKINGIDFQVEGMKGLPVGYFLFPATHDLFAAEAKYWQGDIAIDPRVFITNMKGLKAQVNNVYKSPRNDYNSYKR